MERVFEIEYANHKIKFMFAYPRTATYFGNNIKLASGFDYDVHVEEERLERARTLLPADSSDSYVEYRALIGLTAQVLLRYKCCIFHCVSFIYKGFAWLLTAPSGTGKTTQYLNWQKLFPEEICMISGDMPVIEQRDHSNLYIHPTTWNGKENIGNRVSARLGGVIYLEQGNHNEIYDLSVKDGLIRILNQFVVIPDTEEEIQSLTSIIDCIFRMYPVKLFRNLGDDQSTLQLKREIDQIIQRNSEI